MSTTTYVSSSLIAKAKATCNPSTNPPKPLQPLPAGFDSQLAYVLGLCCNAANDQYTAYVTNTPIIPNDPSYLSQELGNKVGSPKPWDPDFSKIVAQGYTNPTHCNLSVYEKDENGKSVEIPAGFIVRLDPTGTTTSSMIVVAFHGTQNSFELNQIDKDIFPATFGGLLGSESRVSTRGLLCPVHKRLQWPGRFSGSGPWFPRAAD